MKKSLMFILAVATMVACNTNQQSTADEAAATTTEESAIAVKTAAISSLDCGRRTVFPGIELIIAMPTWSR